MTEEELAAIKKRLDDCPARWLEGDPGSWPLEAWALVDGARAGLSALLAEVRLLQGVISDMREDNQSYRTGKEHGLTDALRWCNRHKMPALADPASSQAAWLPGTEGGSRLEPALFRLLEGGERADGIRIYGSCLDALKDLDRAIIRLARRGFPAPEA